MGLNEFVDELARALAISPLKGRYQGHEALVQDVAEVVRGVLQKTLEAGGISYDLWLGVAEAGSKGILPVVAFGAPHMPDMVVDVANRPTVAISAHMVRELKRVPEAIVDAIGRSIILSHQYPAVIAFLYSAGGPIPAGGLVERETLLDLWSQHKVRLLIRQR